MDASLTTGELKRALRELVREEPDFLASLLREAGAISTPPPVRETPAEVANWHGQALTAPVRDGEAEAGTAPEPTRPTRDGKLLRPFGLCAGEFAIPDDFDAPLPADLLDAFEGQ